MNIHSQTNATLSVDKESGSPSLVYNANSTRDKGERCYELQGNIATTMEGDSPEKNEINWHGVRMNCLIGCRFLLATYMWFREYSSPTISRGTSFDPTSGHHVIYGVPTSSIILAWKCLEIISEPRRKSCLKACLSYAFSLLFLMGPVMIFASSLILAFSESAKEFESFGISLILYIGGMLLIIAEKVVDALSAICTFCRSGCSGTNSFIEKNAYPLIQVAGFVCFLPFNDLNIAWSGLFFVWEGILVCVFKEPDALPYWNTLFKVLAFLSFWITSDSFGFFFENREGRSWYALVLPLLFVLSSFSLDAQSMWMKLGPETRKGILGRMVAVVLSFSLIGAFTFSFIYYDDSIGLVIVSLLLALWSFSIWLWICGVRMSQSISILSSFQKRREANTDPGRFGGDGEIQGDNAMRSFYHPMGAFLNAVACGLLFAQSVIILQDSVREQNREFTLMLLSILIGNFYFMHCICFVKVKLHVVKDEDVSPEFAFPEDTYTLMTTSKPFSQPWLMSLLVFGIQASFTSMIIQAQWYQHKAATNFLDVPYDVTLSTRIGQVTGMILIVYYQTDYWVASTLLEIMVFGRKKSETGDNEMQNILSTDDDVENVASFERNADVLSPTALNILIPSIMRLFQCLGVIAASTVLILQSDNIIDLVKDYTAIFFISEIDEFIFRLSLTGYLGGKFSRKADESRKVTVPDVKEHPFRLFGFMAIFSIMLGCWMFVSKNQKNGVFFENEHRACVQKVGNPYRLNALDYSNGECDAYLNFVECNFDGGDCMVENYIREVNATFVYPLCNVTWKAYIGECIFNHT